MNKAIILDFNRTVYDPNTDSLVDGVLDFLEKYKGRFKLALICKGDKNRHEHFEQLGIKKYFDYIEIVPEKTKDVFLDCIKRLSASPELTWVIGDRVRLEIKIAKSLGMNTIWLRRDKFENDLPMKEVEAPHFEVTSFLMASKLIPLGLG